MRAGSAPVVRGAMLIVAVFMSSCAASADPEATVSSDPTTSITTQAPSTAIPVSSPPSVVAQPVLFEHRFFPTIEPEARTNVTYLSQDLERFVAESEAVFTGRVIDVTMDVARTEEFDNGFGLVTLVFDGIVFDVEEGPLYVIFTRSVDIRGVSHLRTLGPAALGLVEDGIISSGNRFVVSRQLDGSPMTVDVLREWLTEGEPRWDPAPEFYPPEDAPPGPISVPIGSP